MKKLAILCSALAATACSPSATVEKSGDESTVTIKTDQGESTISTSKSANPTLPAGFTFYPGAEVISNVTMKEGDGATTIVSFGTGDALAKVVAYYKDQAAKAGVKIGMDLSTPESAMIGGNKDGLDFTFTAGPKDGGGTTGNLSFKTKG